MRVHFHKYQALGNDYLVLDPRDVPFVPSIKGIQYLCDRNRGVGSDGIVFGPLSALESFSGTRNRNRTHEQPQDGDELLSAPSPEAGAFLSGTVPCVRIFNPDGSEAEKSGNGLRIFSLYLVEQGYVEPGEFSIKTRGGTVRAGLKSFEPPRIWVDMGEPSFSAAQAGLRIDAPDFVKGQLSLDGHTVEASFVSMGNPHCVIFVDEPSETLARKYGPLAERNPLFPSRSNVQFVKVLDRHTIQIEIWERGAGYTLASGSSSCAAAAVARRLGLIDCDKEVTAIMPGGSLTLDLSKPSIVMTGPAFKVFEGAFSISSVKLLARMGALGTKSTWSEEAD